MIENSVLRTVVLHPGALGDVLLAIPALRSLRAAARGGELSLAAQPRIARLLAALGVVDRALEFDALGLDALFTTHEPPARLRALLEGARVASWFASRDAHFAHRLRSFAPESVVTTSVPVGPLTVWEHLLASVATLATGAASDAARREPITLRADVVESGRRALLGAGWDGARPLVILHPGAGGVAKRWPVEGFALTAETVADAFGAQVVVHEGPADRDAAVALHDRLGAVACALVDPPLETLAGALHHATLFIGNDSGVTHLAAAVGAPTLALFAEANLAWRPWTSEARVRVVTMGALARPDVDTVIADARGLLRSRDPRAVGARGA